MPIVRRLVGQVLSPGVWKLRTELRATKAQGPDTGMTVWADEVNPSLADDGIVPPPPGLTVSGAESGEQ